MEKGKVKIPLHYKKLDKVKSDLSSDQIDFFKNIKLDEEHSRSGELAKFKNSFGEITCHKFTKLLKQYASENDLSFDERKSNGDVLINLKSA